MYYLSFVLGSNACRTCGVSSEPWEASDVRHQMSPLQHLCVDDLSSCSHMVCTCCNKDRQIMILERQRKEGKHNNLSVTYKSSLNSLINLYNLKVHTKLNTWWGISLMMKTAMLTSYLVLKYLKSAAICLLCLSLSHQLSTPSLKKVHKTYLFST